MHTASNGLKTAALLGLLSAVLIVGGGAIFGGQGVLIGFVLALALNGWSYFFSDRLALRSMQARPVSWAALSQDPLALASALRKLQLGTAALPLPQAPGLVTASHMMIANPFRGSGMGTLFATHPPMEQRIARLEQLAREHGQLGR